MGSSEQESKMSREEQKKYLLREKKLSKDLIKGLRKKAQESNWTYRKNGVFEKEVHDVIFTFFVKGGDLTFKGKDKDNLFLDLSLKITSRKLEEKKVETLKELLSITENVDCNDRENWYCIRRPYQSEHLKLEDSISEKYTLKVLAWAENHIDYFIKNIGVEDFYRNLFGENTSSLDLNMPLFDSWSFYHMVSEPESAQRSLELACENLDRFNFNDCFDILLEMKKKGSVDPIWEDITKAYFLPTFFNVKKEHPKLHDFDLTKALKSRLKGKKYTKKHFTLLKKIENLAISIHPHVKVTRGASSPHALLRMELSFKPLAIEPIYWKIVQTDKKLQTSPPLSHLFWGWFKCLPTRIFFSNHWITELSSEEVIELCLKEIEEIEKFILQITKRSCTSYFENHPNSISYLCSLIADGELDKAEEYASNQKQDAATSPTFFFYATKYLKKEPYNAREKGYTQTNSSILTVNKSKFKDASDAKD